MRLSLAQTFCNLAFEALASVARYMSHITLGTFGAELNKIILCVLVQTYISIAENGLKNLC